MSRTYSDTPEPRYVETALMVGNILRASIGAQSMIVAYKNETDVVASGKYSIAGGEMAEASGELSLAFGAQSPRHPEYYVKATGEGSIAWYFGQASGKAAVAIGGIGTTNSLPPRATGAHSIAMGTGTLASATLSTAIGDSCEATSYYTFAIGQLCKANGAASIAMGVQCETNRTAQVVVGKYNVLDENAIFIVGDGKSTEKHNGFVIYKDNTTNEYSMKLGDTIVKESEFGGGGAVVTCKLANTPDYQEVIVNTSPIILEKASILALNDSDTGNYSRLMITKIVDEGYADVVNENDFYYYDVAQDSFVSYAVGERLHIYAIHALDYSSYPSVSTVAVSFDSNKNAVFYEAQTPD